jgi:hypothetical protein
MFPLNYSYINTFMLSNITICLFFIPFRGIIDARHYESRVLSWTPSSRMSGTRHAGLLLCLPAFAGLKDMQQASHISYPISHISYPVSRNTHPESFS